MTENHNEEETSHLEEIPLEDDEKPLKDLTFQDIKDSFNNNKLVKLTKTKVAQYSQLVTQGNKNSAKKKLYVASLICLIFFAIELAGGLLANSLALVADSFHLLTDFAMYSLSLVSIILANRQKTKQYTYGYKRLEVMGALASLILLWILAGYLVNAAWDRLKHTVTIDAPLMASLSILSLTVNILLLVILNSSSLHSTPSDAHTDATSINLRASIIHALGDLVTSIGVVISSFIIVVFPKFGWLDPVCTLIFVGVIVISTSGIAMDVYKTFMQAAPEGYDLEEAIKELDGVLDVHEYHAWALVAGENVVTVHVVAEEKTCREVLGTVDNFLAKHEIQNRTIQVEIRGINECVTLVEEAKEVTGSKHV